MPLLDKVINFCVQHITQKDLFNEFHMDNLFDVDFAAFHSLFC